MELVYDRCCGIDIHKRMLVACFICGKQKQIREWGTTTKELLDLSNWLLQVDCQMVAMESTGSYWKPIYNIFELQGLFKRF